MVPLLILFTSSQLENEIRAVDVNQIGKRFSSSFLTTDNKSIALQNLCNNFTRITQWVQDNISEWFIWKGIFLFLYFYYLYFIFVLFYFFDLLMGLKCILETFLRKHFHIFLLLDFMLKRNGIGGLAWAKLELFIIFSWWLSFSKPFLRKHSSIIFSTFSYPKSVQNFIETLIIYHTPKIYFSLLDDKIKKLNFVAKELTQTITTIKKGLLRKGSYSKHCIVSDQCFLLQGC